MLALFAVGRFGIFFVRLDSEELALGLNSAQGTSLALLLLATAGAAITGRKSLRSLRPSTPA